MKTVSGKKHNSNDQTVKMSKLGTGITGKGGLQKIRKLNIGGGQIIRDVRVDMN